MKYSKEIYDRDVLVKSAYVFSDRVYVHLDVEEDYFVVDFQSKDLKDATDYRKAFENELLAQQTRKIVSRKTKNIRELIAARALSSTIVELEEGVKEEESGFRADDILKDWFEENE